MKFGPVASADAAGSILAHSLKLQGKSIRKGTRLAASHVGQLMAAGIDRVVVARLEDTDVDEDRAAQTLAKRLAGCGVNVSAPFTGRCNLFAARDGVAVIDAEIVNALNGVDEAVTVATIAPFHPVAERQMLATVKIIPFAIGDSALAAALERCGDAAAVRVAIGSVAQVTLIQTMLPGTRESVLDKTRNITEERLGGLGLALDVELRCDHHTQALAERLGQVLAAGSDLVLVVGASAIVDRRDVIPAAVEVCGGDISRFGMPVDPGNLMLFARCGDVPVLGLPGCARSASYNGLDQVLARIAAGEAVTSESVSYLGVGGLLKEFPERPQPRRRGARARVAERPGQALHAAPRVTALVLAAGQSRRMGERNKLLIALDGKPMLAHVLDAVAQSQVAGCIVVTGHQASDVRALLAGRNVSEAHNPDYAHGLSTSLAQGLHRLPADTDAVLVCLGDMPRVCSRDIDRLIAAFDPGEGRAICVPTVNGKRGNPVLWHRRYLDEMASVRGDVGARHLIGQHEDMVCEVPMESNAVLIDVDTPAALSALDDVNAR